MVTKESLNKKYTSFLRDKIRELEEGIETHPGAQIITPFNIPGLIGELNYGLKLKSYREDWAHSHIDDHSPRMYGCTELKARDFLPHKRFPFSPDYYMVLMKSRAVDEYAEKKTKIFTSPLPEGALMPFDEVTGKIFGIVEMGSDMWQRRGDFVFTAPIIDPEVNVDDWTDSYHVKIDFNSSNYYSGISWNIPKEIKEGKKV